MKHVVTPMAVVLSTCAWTGLASADQFNLTVAAGHPPASIGVAGVRDFFIPEIDRRLEEAGGEHSIQWTEAYGGSLADFRGVLEAVEDGIADMGYVAHLFEADKLPLEQITYLVPFGTDSTVVQMEIIDRLHDEVPEMLDAWGEYNQMVLAPTGIDTYHFVTDFPISDISDLSGRRLSVSGLATNWLGGTDAVPVSGALPTYYNSMATGLTEGMVTFESAVASYSFHEVAQIVTRVNFGAQYSSALTINQEAWERLPEEVQAVFLEVAGEYRTRIAEAYETAGERSLTRAVEAGATVVAADPQFRQELADGMQNVALEWAADMDARGLPGSLILKTYLDLANEAGVTFVRDWSE